ncbi:MAG: NAD-dependent epimerase/dehydratase family protein, partial [Bacteroidaceae bacterium]|nr:NAD-dependent epimerase/dehydratase family protein [Bacteroidaceae bacterium]
MKNVIITGADGFVGSYTVAHFIQEGCNVLALDMGPEPRRLTPSKQLKYMQCDISDIEGML